MRIPDCLPTTRSIPNQLPRDQGVVQPPVERFRIKSVLAYFLTLSSDMLNTVKLTGKTYRLRPHTVTSAS